MMPYDTTRWKALPSKNPCRASVRKCSTCLGALSGANSKRNVPRSVATTASRSLADCPSAAAIGQRRSANREVRIASIVTFWSEVPLGYRILSGARHEVGDLPKCRPIQRIRQSPDREGGVTIARQQTPVPQPLAHARGSDWVHPVPLPCRTPDPVGDNE